MAYKIQVLNGFKMYFEQMISVFKNRYDSADKIDLDQLAEITGLNRRKARLILNYFADIGLSEKRTLNKTFLGNVIYKHDEFLQNEGTLWILHYLHSTNEYLIIWNRTLNALYDENVVTRDSLLTLFNDLKSYCSEYSFNHHIGKEIRIILDAYENQQFNRLSLIEHNGNKHYTNRNPDVPLLIILATILLYKEINYPGATSIDINELCNSYNSPGRMFLIDETTFRGKLEELKKLGLINIESRADLDQVRLKDNQTFIGTIESYYNA